MSAKPTAELERIERLLMEFALRAANAQREVDRIIAEFREDKFVPAPDLRDADQKDREEEQGGSTR